MEEIKIKVSIKVWIYIILAVAACFAIIMGISRAVGGPGVIGADKYYMITMFICMTSIILVPAYIKRRTKLVVTDVQLRVNAPEPWVVQLSGFCLLLIQTIRLLVRDAISVGNLLNQLNRLLTRIHLFVGKNLHRHLLLMLLVTYK